VAFGFDAAFREWPDIARQPIGELEVMLFVRKGHPLLAEPVITRDMLARYPFVSPSDSRPYGAVIREVYETKAVESRVYLHITDHFPLVRQIVASSDAVAVVAATHAHRAAFRRQFETLPLELFSSAPLCCAVRARWEPSPAARAFIAAMHESAGS